MPFRCAVRAPSGRASSDRLWSVAGGRGIRPPRHPAEGMGKPDVTRNRRSGPARSSPIAILSRGGRPFRLHLPWRDGGAQGGGRSRFPVRGARAVRYAGAEISFSAERRIFRIDRQAWHAVPGDLSGWAAYAGADPARSAERGGISGGRRRDRDRRCAPQLLGRIAAGHGGLRLRARADPGRERGGRLDGRCVPARLLRPDVHAVVQLCGGGGQSRPTGDVACAAPGGAEYGADGGMGRAARCSRHASQHG